MTEKEKNDRYIERKNVQEVTLADQTGKKESLLFHVINCSLVYKG